MRTLWSGRDISAGQGKAAKGVWSGNKIQFRKELDDMQMSAGSLYRVHAACALSPTRSPSFAWVASKRLTASRGSRSAIHTVQAAEQKAAGSEPSKVNVKGQTSSNLARNCKTWLLHHECNFLDDVGSCTGPCLLPKDMMLTVAVPRKNMRQTIVDAHAMQTFDWHCCIVIANK